MSPLPEKKKSADEISRLREDLGIVPREARNAPEEAPSRQPAAREERPAAPPRGPKPVRSLKRSEREPAPRRRPSAPPAHHGDSPLPESRHSPEELEELRRRDARSALAEGGFKMPHKAPYPLLGVGYALALGGAASPLGMRVLGKLMQDYRVSLALHQGYDLLVGGCIVSLLIAVHVFFHRTLSRHHAAIMAVIALLALVFAVLHYFPDLKYGQ